MHIQQGQERLTGSLKIEQVENIRLRGRQKAWLNSKISLVYAL